jgi:hypothetical protein
MLRIPGAAALALLACAPAQAGLISFNAAPYTGDPSRATVTFDDSATPGSVKVTVAVDTGVSLADINGFFINSRDEAILPGLRVTGDMTSYIINPNRVTSAGPGNNVNGGGVGAFDVGIQVGTPGIGKDDIRTATFYLSDPGVALTNDMFTGANAEGVIFAVRLTSVGPDGARNGSSKLRDGGPVTPPVLVPPPIATPEPSTLAGLAVLSTLGLCARRLRRGSAGPQE